MTTYDDPAAWLPLITAALALLALLLRREPTDPVDAAIDEAIELCTPLADEVEAWLRTHADLTDIRQIDPREEA